MNTKDKEFWEKYSKAVVAFLIISAIYVSW